MSQYYPATAQCQPPESPSSPGHNYSAQQYSLPSSHQPAIPPRDPRYYQGHQRTQSQAYPPSSFPNAYSYPAQLQSQLPHQLPQAPPHVAHAANGHVIPAPSPQYPPNQSAISAPATGFASPTSPTAFRRPLPTPGLISHPPSSYFDRSPLPTPGPTPAPASPPSRRQPPNSPSSVTSFSGRPRTPGTSSASSPASPTSPSGGRRPLPTPHPRPAHIQSSDTGVRSSSPVKDAIHAFHALQGPSPFPAGSRPPSPTKFVPYWKRTLPAPNSDRSSVGAHPQGWNPGTPQGEGTQRDRSQSVTSGRPLPASPSQPLDIRILNLGSASSNGTPSADSDRSRALPDPTSLPALRSGPRARSPTKSIISNGRMTSPTRDAPVAGPSKPYSCRSASPTKSFLPNGTISPSSSEDETSDPSDGPQYGIRDLPTRSSTIIDHNNARHTRAPASIDRTEEGVCGRLSRSSTLPQPPLPPPLTQSHHRATQSVTIRSAMAFSPIAGSSPRAPPVSTPTSPAGWPSTLPPLPRAPASSSGSHFSMRSQREYVNLDDAPPPSLRRSPSPAASTRSAGPSRFPAFTSTAQRPSAVNGSQNFPRHANASNPLSPKKSSHPLPQAPNVRSQPGDVTFGFSGLPVTNSRIPSPERRIPSPERQRSYQNPPADRGHRVPAPPNPRSASPERQPRVAVPEHHSRPPMAAPVPSIPMISFDTGGSFSEEFASELGDGHQINISGPETPQISIGVSPPSVRGQGPSAPRQRREHLPGVPPPPPTGRTQPVVARRGGGLACGGCGGPIVGRIVSAMGIRWHPGCFRCSDCDELLEYVSSYEHAGKPYCHFDYHERFAPRCYHCKTAIVDERFITLDDRELGKRTYHEQHFFCSECGDPFLAPSVPRAPGATGELKFTGDGEFEDDDVGFTVYKGYPYCESCHVRLRSPKCKKCKKNIRDGMQAVEALGGKWHFECFTCTSCDKPFEDPSFFLRDKKPFCENCFSSILKSEM